MPGVLGYRSRIRIWVVFPAGRASHVYGRPAGATGPGDFT